MDCRALLAMTALCREASLAVIAVHLPVIAVHIRAIATLLPANAHMETSMAASRLLDKSDVQPRRKPLK